MSQPPKTFQSSIKDDVWHDQTGDGAFECWTFDALSDDGREAVSISFYDNYVLSPRYAKQAGMRVPAVTFVYSVDGKSVYHKTVEYPAHSFRAERETAELSIGRNRFRVDKADYGSGYMLNLELPSRGGRTIEVSMEWLSIEADMLERNQTGGSSWNIVAPRSDVSGRITLIGRRGQAKKTCQFRGTGTHDHFGSRQHISESFATRQWGHAHFVDATAIFLRQTIAVGEQFEKLYVVTNGRIDEYDAVFDETHAALGRYGARYPRNVTVKTDCGIGLTVKPVNAIESGFCNVKLVSEMTLVLPGHKTHTTNGIAEFFSTARMQSGLFRFLNGLGIKRDQTVDQPSLTAVP